MYTLTPFHKLELQMTTQNIPSQIGKRIVITGATGGLGFETALALASVGAEVILTGRDAAKGQIALNLIRAQYPSAVIRYENLDLASLASITDFTKRFSQEFDALDILINNAGVMAYSKRQTTVDGFEKQIATNYLGHFALTAQLLPKLRASLQPRVVNISSLVHKMGVIQFDNLQSERCYQPNAAYNQSKLAMLMFTFELQRLSNAGGWNLMSNAAHPGFAQTDLIANGPGLDSFLVKTYMFIKPLFSQSAAAGALPTLFAATSLDAKNAGYYGPQGLFETKGSVGEASVTRSAKDLAVAKRLWEVSVQLTSAEWP
jgi:NAD(P)-dependent dehydrogenase (short-subunit alcohol dehydrogenase family)